MKVSTRARYGLRMMVELTRGLKKEDIVQLGKIAKVTNLSESYLAQLAIPLKKAGLIVGVSGKKGGYLLGRLPEKIKISEIINTLTGPIGLTDCVNNPEICLNYGFCEARIIWTILSGRIQEILEGFTLADMVSKDRMASIKDEYKRMPLLEPDLVLAEIDADASDSCPSIKATEIAAHPNKTKIKFNKRRQPNLISKGSGR